MSDPISPSHHERQLSFLGDLAQDTQPLAICTLTNDELRDQLMKEEELQGVVVGSLHTENLGIEQIISYALSNPSIRFILLCGTDGQQAIGHLPGQSFLALAKNGIDTSGRIIGAKGKRPIIKNLSSEAIAHFREYVDVIDMVGCNEVEKVLERVRQCRAEAPGPAEAFLPSQQVEPIQGEAPDHIVLDPCGYFVIYVDHVRSRIILEHYNNKGVLGTIIEGKRAAELYFPAIEQGIISRLDHAAYLGRELQRAEHALSTMQAYIQDA